MPLTLPPAVHCGISEICQSPDRSGAADSISEGPQAPAVQQAIVPLPRAVFQSGVYVSIGLRLPDLSRSPHSFATRVTSGEVKSIVMFWPSTTNGLAPDSQRRPKKWPWSAVKLVR